MAKQEVETEQLPLEKKKVLSAPNNVEVAFLERDAKGFPASYTIREVPEELANDQLSKENRNPHWVDACWPKDMNKNLTK